MRGSNTPKPLSPRKRPRINIEIANRQHRRIVRKSILRAIRAVLTSRHWSDAEISVAIVDRWTIRQLNAEYLQHDYATDVLSFLFQRSPKTRRLVGEIVVCAEVAAQVAARQKWKWHDELLLYVVHGTLHLVGYNDKTTMQLRRMQAAEQKILCELGIQVPSGGLSLRSKDIP
jgi:probable rRNA maturation factor